MTYMQRFMTLQKEYIGQQDDVYGLPRRVYDTLEGVCDDKWVVMTCRERFMALQKEYVG